MQEFAIVNNLELYHRFNGSSVPVISFGDSTDNTREYVFDEEILDYLVALAPQTFAFAIDRTTFSDSGVELSKTVVASNYPFNALVISIRQY